MHLGQSTRFPVLGVILLSTAISLFSRPSSRAAANELPPIDTLKFAALSPEDAAKEMPLPVGFKATLFAGEPDVKQPIAFAMDDRVVCGSPKPILIPGARPK